MSTLSNMSHIGHSYSPKLKILRLEEMERRPRQLIRGMETLKCEETRRAGLY